MADSITFVEKPLTPGLNMGTRGDNKIEYLAIHYTAGGNSKPGASSNLDSIDSWKRGDASADFSVDDGTFTKYNQDPQKYYCYSVGDKLYSNTKGGTFHGKCTNRNSISIEVCSSLKSGAGAKYGNHAGWYFTQETLSNAVKLARYLMQTYSIPLSNVVRHWDVSGKPCPGIPGWNLDPLVDENSYASLGKDNDESQWLAFKQAIQNGGDIVATSSSSNSNDNSTTSASPSSGPTNSCGGAPAVDSSAAADTSSSGAFDSSAEANATSTDTSATTNSSKFVDLASYGLKCDARYATANNFTGAVVPGYKKAACWGKKELAEALKKVNEDLKKQGMELVIFDAYRPKAALDAFIAWKGKNRCTSADLIHQPFGYTIKPDFKGLISDKSTHNYGLSVDLTIRNNSNDSYPKVLWEGEPMGTRLDEFMIKRDTKSKQSSSGYWYENSIPVDGKTKYNSKNAQHRFLRSIMEKYKFQGIPSEWWHFQLNGAQYCNTNTEMIQ